jgi:hypothetical protein
MRKQREISINEVEHLKDDEYVVRWSWIDSSFPHDSLVTCEFEPRDPGVGIPESYFFGTGDCPKEVEEAAAEAASLRAADAYDDARADAYDRERD